MDSILLRKRKNNKIRTLYEVKEIAEIKEVLFKGRRQISESILAGNSSSLIIILFKSHSYINPGSPKTITLFFLL
jgi:hypothetical protein